MSDMQYIMTVKTEVKNVITFKAVHSNKRCKKYL